MRARDPYAQRAWRPKEACARNDPQLLQLCDSAKRTRSDAYGRETSVERLGHDPRGDCLAAGDERKRVAFLRGEGVRRGDVGPARARPHDARAVRTGSRRGAPAPGEAEKQSGQPGNDARGHE